MGKGSRYRPESQPRAYADGFYAINPYCRKCRRWVTPRARDSRGWVDEKPVGWVGSAWYACPFCGEALED